MSVSRVVQAGEIRGVLLPVGPRYLLLPNAAVAEIIAYQAPRRQGRGTGWLLGQVEWRGRRIPLVSLERALGLDVDVDGARRVRIAVLNTLSGDPDLPYIGLLTLGISRLTRVNRANMVPEVEVDMESPLIHAGVTVTHQPAWIPNLDELERMVKAAV